MPGRIGLRRHPHQRRDRSCQSELIFFGRGLEASSCIFIRSGLTNGYTAQRTGRLLIDVWCVVYNKLNIHAQNTCAGRSSFITGNALVRSPKTCGRSGGGVQRGDKLAFHCPNGILSHECGLWRVDRMWELRACKISSHKIALERYVVRYYDFCPSFGFRCRYHTYRCDPSHVLSLQLFGSFTGQGGQFWCDETNANSFGLLRPVCLVFCVFKFPTGREQDRRRD